MRSCSGCLVSHYCSTICSRAAWSVHKLECKTFNDVREKALLAHLEQGISPGSAARNMKMDRDAMGDWWNNAGLVREKVVFLAWKHRHESPIISVMGASTTSVLSVDMTPRSLWDDVQRMGPDDDTENTARVFFARGDFNADLHFVTYFHFDKCASGAESAGVSMRPFEWQGRDEIHRSVYETLTADEYIAEVSRRTEAPNAVYVRLIGLRGAAQLNGQEGVLKGQDPNNLERYTVCVGGKDFSVRSENYELVQRPNLLVAEFS
jgi:hypothetical protein